MPPAPLRLVEINIGVAKRDDARIRTHHKNGLLLPVTKTDDPKDPFADLYTDKDCVYFVVTPACANELVLNSQAQRKDVTGIRTAPDMKAAVKLARTGLAATAKPAAQDNTPVYKILCIPDFIYEQYAPDPKFTDLIHSPHLNLVNLLPCARKDHVTGNSYTYFVADPKGIQDFLDIFPSSYVAIIPLRQPAKALWDAECIADEQLHQEAQQKGGITAAPKFKIIGLSKQDSFHTFVQDELPRNALKLRREDDHDSRGDPIPTYVYYVATTEAVDRIRQGFSGMLGGGNRITVYNLENGEGLEKLSHAESTANYQLEAPTPARPSRPKGVRHTGQHYAGQTLAQGQRHGIP